MADGYSSLMRGLQLWDETRVVHKYKTSRDSSVRVKSWIFKFEGDVSFTAQGYTTVFGLVIDPDSAHSCSFTLKAFSLGTNSWLFFWRTGNTNGSLLGFPKMVKSPESLGRFLLSLLWRREADEAEHLDTQGCFSKTFDSPEEEAVICCLSVVGGAWLPLPGQEVFGFEVEHVPVGFSLLALAVHVLLGVLHHLLGLLHHLTGENTKLLTFLHQKELLWGPLLI